MAEIKSSISGIDVQAAGDTVFQRVWVATMNVTIKSTNSAPQFRLRNAWQASDLSGWPFFFVAVLLLFFLIFFGYVFVVALSFSEVSLHLSDRLLDRVWALASLLVLSWALVNLRWLEMAARDHLASSFHMHLGVVVGCGLMALGIHSVQIARFVASEPIIMDYSAQGKKSRPSAPTTGMVAGDAEEGRKIFSTTCVTCHGPTGGGMPNLAPSLKGSEFIASADATAIARVIRLGRAPSDPANKTKRVMPARGGNPFLGDDKIAHLVAFVQQIQSGELDPVLGESGDAPPPVQLAKWVVPDAQSPPSGMVRWSERHDAGDAAGLATRKRERRAGLLKSATLGLTLAHCLMLLGVVGLSSCLMLSSVMGKQAQVLGSDVDGARSWWSLFTVGWNATALVWLLVFVCGFVIT